MIKRTWGEEFRTTMVCIDSWQEGIPAGRIYNAYLPQGRRFHGVMQFLQEMEQILEQMDFPRSFTATRSFCTIPSIPADSPMAQEPGGKLATFALRILFRQNVSWQGSVTWLEGKQEQSFRSVLELMLLVNNALTYEQVS